MLCLFYNDSSAAKQVSTATCYLKLLHNITKCNFFRYNYIMAAFSVMFLVVSWSLTKFLGGLGFIIANCCNMLARIIHSVWFIRKSFYHSKLQPLSGMIPTRYYFISLCVTLIITKISEVMYLHLYLIKKMYLFKIELLNKKNKCN